MPRLVRTFPLEAQADKVWSLLGDPGAWPRFVRHLNRAGWAPQQSGSPPTVDIHASYRSVFTWSGSVACTIDSAERVVVIGAARDATISAEGRLRVREIGSGGCAVELDAEYQIKVPLIGGLVRAKLDGYLASTAAALQQTALTA